MQRLLLLLVLVGCGSSSITGDDIDAPVGGGTIDAAPNGPCTGATNCPEGSVCNPATMTCTANLPCTTHADCGKEAYCTASDTCARNTPHGPCDNDDNCVGQESCDEDTHICGCGGQPLGAEVVVPNVLIAIDRSSSMGEGSGTVGQSKWDAAKAAVGTVVDAYNAHIRFGLDLWPGTGQFCSGGAHCSGGQIFIDIGPNNAEPIKDFLEPITDSGTGERLCNLGTPLGNSLQLLTTYAGLDDTTRNNYVLYMTDGMENCNPEDNDADPLVAAMSLLTGTPSVRTFVVGFGSGISASQLDAIARAGGTERPGSGDDFYRATSPQELLDAFESIVGQVVSCTFTLSEPPQDPSRLYVVLGNTEIVRDTTQMNGWDYDPSTMTLTFYGTSCDTIRGGGGNLAVSYGCPLIP